MKTAHRLVATVTGRPAELRTKHYRGLPPELTDGQDARKMMGWPAVLLIREEGDGSASLYRYTAEREIAGDTWHETLDDAKHQAEFEFAPHYSEWVAVPPNIEDPVAYALSRMKE